jgi:hypothetical protein
VTRRSDNAVIVLVLLAFVGVILWLLNRTQIEHKPTLPPLTTYSAQPDGALALFELAESVGLEPLRFGETEYHYPPQACVVLLDAAPFGGVFGGALDPKAIRLWLERGGRLVLCQAPGGNGVSEELLEELGAADPTPTVIREASTPRCEAVHVKAGIVGKLTPRTRFEETGDVYELPQTRFALFAGVAQIEHGKQPAQVIEAVQLLGSDSPVLWYRKVGEGELYWLTRPEMASNSWISRADNHRLLLNVLQTAARDRQLIFDEHIHGYARETPNLMAILAHTRGGHLLLLLCGLGLLLFAGAAVRPAKYASNMTPERRQGVEMVLAQADLYERADARHVIADSLVDSLRRAFVERRHLAAAPSEGQLLTWVEQEWRGDERRGRTLGDYLRSRALPRTSRALLDLARACDDAKSMLS